MAALKPPRLSPHVIPAKQRLGGIELKPIARPKRINERRRKTAHARTLKHAQTDPLEIPIDKPFVSGPGTHTRHTAAFWEAGGLPTPSVADRRPDSFKVTDVSLPLARGL
ncbi:MAG: hypothetical protein ACRDL5_12330, partial [Solirubrobacteraceae bacterium]